MANKKKPTSKHEIKMDHETAIETIIRIEENPAFFGLKKTNVAYRGVMGSLLRQDYYMGDED